MTFFALFFLLSVAVPAALPVALLFSTVGDWMLPFAGFKIYSNEWALFGGVLGLALRQAWKRDLPPLPWRWILAFLPLCLVLLAHAAGPGSASDAVKASLRASQLALALILPIWLLNPFTWERSLRLVLLFVAVASAWGLTQTLAGPGHPMNMGHEAEALYHGTQAAYSFFQQHNQFGAFLCAGIPLALAAAGAGRRPWAWAVAVLALAALAATLSRGAWLGFAVGALVMSWRLPIRSARLLAFGGLAAVLLMLSSSVLRERFASAFVTPSHSDRAVVWGVGMDIAEGHWLWGRGPGIVAKELSPRLEVLPMLPQDRVMLSSHLHNQWLQWGVESGLIALAAWALFLCVAALPKLPEGATDTARWFAWAAGASLVAFTLQGFTDIVALHARGIQLALLWGLALSGVRHARGSNEGSF